MRLPGLDFSQVPTGEVERMVVKITGFLQDHFGEDLEQVMQKAGRLYKVQANRTWHLSEEDEPLRHIRKRYGLTWEV